MKNIIPLIIGCLTLAVFSCQMDKYHSSNLDSEPGRDQTTFSGQVTRLDTGLPIEYASVRIGTFQTSTDIYGRYELELTFDRDDNKNVRTPLIITADNYVDHISAVYITPIPQNKNIQLLWRPAILVNVAFVDHQSNPDRQVFQAIVRDYEGTDNVLYVKVGYIGKESPPIQRMYLEVNLWLVETVDEYTGYYQSGELVRTANPDDAFRFDIDVLIADKSGYSEKRHVRLDPLSQMQPLFPVNW